MTASPVVYPVWMVIIAVILVVVDCLLMCLTVNFMS